MSGYSFACKSLGMNCDFEIRGAASKDEILQETATHAKLDHQMATMAPDIVSKVRSSIVG